MKHIRIFVAATLAILGSHDAIAQTSTANAIRIVVPSQPGGAMDPYARLIAKHMTDTLNHPVIVDNRPGASGNISGNVVTQAPADGLTIWNASAAMYEINPFVFSSLLWKQEDFVPLIKGVEAPLVLVTHPSVPATNLKQLVDWAKAHSKNLGYATFGAGSPSAFMGFLMNEKFGLTMLQVPFSSTPPQVTALLGNHVTLGFAQLGGVAALVKDGQLTAYAVTSPERARLLPDVPTFKELGYPEFNAGTWFGLFVRQGTPQDKIDRLMEAIVSAHADPEIRRKLIEQGYDVPALTGDKLLTQLKAETEGWKQLIKVSGFKSE